MAHQSKWKKSVFEIYQDASINLEWTEALRDECKDTSTSQALTASSSLISLIPTWTCTNRIRRHHLDPNP